jgi:poly(A) polymerase
MQILDIPAGRDVGLAWKFLKELRLDRGPIGYDAAREELLRWWEARS